MKIALVSSHGGHFTQTLQLLDAFKEHEIFFATYHSSRKADILRIAPAYFTNNIGTSPWRLICSTFWALKILLHERPDVIISLGAEIAIPFLYLGKIMRIRTIYIESWCRVENLSKTARIVYPIVDIFLVQWPQLLKVCGSKASYEGSVI